VTDHVVSRTSDGLMLKQYRPNAGDLPHREWLALQILHEYAPGLAPEPVAADLDATPPSVTMTALPGEALGGQPLSSAELHGIGAALDRMHTCVPQQVLADVRLRAHSPRKALRDTTGRLAAQPRPGNDAVTARAYDEALRWLAEPETYQLLSVEPSRAVLARADHNLTNFLWDGGRVRLVDFEYAGRSDRCDELAELVEHISARCTPDDVWQQFLHELDLSRDERARLLTIRRLLAAMWFFMLLPGQDGARRNPPGTLRKQAQRTLELLGA
jgi:aminoglycoside phosphotransferase